MDGGPDGGGNPDAAGDSGAPSWALTGLDKSIITSVSVDRKAPSIVYIGTSGGGAERGVWRTKDDGKTWSKLGGGLPDEPTFVVLHPYTGVVFANPGASGLWHSDDGGDTWVKSTSALDDPGGTSGFVCHPTQNVAWALATQTGVYRTENGGVSWVHTPNTGLPLNQFSLGPIGFGGAKLYLGTAGHGIYVSTDGGDSWSQAASANLPTTGALSEAIGIAASASQPGVVYVKTNGALYKSTDGAASFTKLELGADVRYVTLLQDPAHPSTLWTSMNETSGGPGGLFTSTDEGQSWASAGPDAQPVAAADVAPDGTLWAGTIGRGIWRLRK